MRIAFDMDGTITEGKYIKPPRTFEAYMELGPYDKDTKTVFNRLSLHHEIFLITARSDHRADVMIQSWFKREGLWYPTSIISGIPQQAKWFLARLMNCDLLIDDSPLVAEQAYDRTPQLLFMNNPAWVKNQDAELYPHIKRVGSWKELGDIIATIDYRELHKQLTTR